MRCASWRREATRSRGKIPALLSPYWTRPIKPFGDYVLDWDELAPALEDEFSLPILAVDLAGYYCQ
jgi:hypothetical protein